MAETSAISIDDYTPDFSGATSRVNKLPLPGEVLSNDQTSAISVTPQAVAQVPQVQQITPTTNTAQNAPSPTMPQPNQQVDGGSGYSSLGASIGGMFGPEGSAIGAGAGSLVDIATGMVTAYDAREQEREMKRELKMKEMKANAKLDFQNRITNKQNEETHSLNLDIGNFNLENSKMQMAQAKADKFAKVVSGYYAKTSKGAL